MIFKTAKCLSAIVLVKYFLITNYPSLSSFKEHLLSYKFCGLGIWAWFSWVLCFLVFDKPAIKVLAVPPKVMTGEACAFKFFQWLLTGFSSFWIVGLRALVPCWLLVIATLISLPHGPLHSLQLVSSKLVSQEGSKKEVIVIKSNHESDLPLLLLYSTY